MCVSEVCEYDELSAVSAIRWIKALDVAADRLDRMFSSSDRDDAARSRFRRLAEALIGGAGFSAAAFCLLIPGYGLAAMASGAGAVVLLMLASLGMASFRWQGAGESGALIAGAAAMAWLVALGGGPASPLALAALMLPLEAFRVRQTRTAWQAGALAAGLALAAAWLMRDMLSIHAPAEAVFWLPVMLWGAVLAARRHDLGGVERNDPLLSALASDAVLLRFEPGGELADVSPSARAVLRLAPELLLAGAFFERLHVADRVTFLCALADLRHGAQRRCVTLRLRLLRGTSAGDNIPGRDIHGSFTLELVRTGRAETPFAGLLRDDAAAASLRAEAQAAAESVERAAAEKARLLAVLGHELRTPLNAIIGFAAMLQQESLGGFRDPRQKEYAGLIQVAGEHLALVADGVLETGKLGAGARAVERQPFALRETVDLCRSMLALPAAARGISILCETGAAPGTIETDRGIVQQILVNLLSNAVKFTPEGGRVVVGADLIEGDLRLWVSDTGVGIEDADLHRVGTPFARFGRDGAEICEGSGLGLSLVKDLVALLGGSLSVQSRAGTGTLAAVTLPGCAGSPTPDRDARQASVSTILQERNRHGATRRKTA